MTEDLSLESNEKLVALSVTIEERRIALAMRLVELKCLAH
jgi:hypothetical protein